MTQNYKMGLIIEQALGHITYGQNLQKNISFDDEIEPFWSFPQQPKSGIKALPIIRNWTLQASVQANRSIRQMVTAGNRPDVLFFHTQITAILARKWMTQIPSVVSLDATPIQYDNMGDVYEHSKGPAALEKLKFDLNKACYERAKHLVTWSEWARASLIKDYQIDGDKVTVIHPGVNVNEWVNPDKSDSNADNTSQPVRILFVGGNLKRKGGADLIEAFHMAKRELTNIPIELHLVTRDFAESGGGVIVYNNMKSNTPELHALYEQADIFCMPTYGDFLPMVFSEAAASALPIIATDIAANRERILQDESGLLIKPGDVQGLKEALVALVKNPAKRKQMGQRALEHTKQAFDAKVNALRLFALLKQVAKNEK